MRSRLKKQKSAPKRSTTRKKSVTFDYYGFRVLFLRKFRIFLRRTILICVMLLLFLAMGVSGWIWFKGQGHAIAKILQGHFEAMSSDLGLVVENIYVAGQVHTKDEDILNRLVVKVGDPILGFNPEEVRTRLQTVNWIDQAVVERHLPSTIHIHLQEREAIAIYQKTEGFYVIDNQGEVIEKIKQPPFESLPIVRGEGAPFVIQDMVSLLKNSGIYPEISALEYFGQRRWDLILDSDIRVKLPEKEVQGALGFIVSMRKDGTLKKGSITAIDLRVKDRVFITRPILKKDK